MVEREWREARDLRFSFAGIALVLLAAAVLRFWGIASGIPYALGADEPVIMTTAVRMMRTGDFNPHFFDYPGLYIYLQLVVAIARFLTGAIEGVWKSIDKVGPDHYYLWGRYLTALLGIATVYLVHQIGARWGSRHALLAAGLLAVMPLHVRESHFVLTDVPLTFFTTLTMLLTLRAHEKATLGAFAWAGVAAGLATATKYNGLLALSMPLVAAWMTPEVKPSRLSSALAAAAACLAAFLIGAPYTVLDLPNFLRGFGELAASYRPRPGELEPGWVVYLKHLRNAFHWPALLLAFGGLGMALVRALRGPGRIRWTLLVVFTLLYFYVIATKTLIYGRYLLPIIPAICLLASNAVVSGVSLLRRFAIPRAPRTALIVGLTLAAIVPPAVTAINFDRQFATPGTQALTHRWISDNLPKGSAIAIENFVVRMPEGYRIRQVSRLINHDYEQYIQAGFEYLVASSEVSGQVLDHPDRFPEEHAKYDELFGHAVPIQRFAPAGRIQGPAITIYRLHH